MPTQAGFFRPTTPEPSVSVRSTPKNAAASALSQLDAGGNAGKAAAPLHQRLIFNGGGRRASGPAAFTSSVASDAASAATSVSPVAVHRMLPARVPSFGWSSDVQLSGMGPEHKETESGRRRAGSVACDGCDGGAFQSGSRPVRLSGRPRRYVKLAACTPTGPRSCRALHLEALNHPYTFLYTV